ncbi:MAG TPA: DUF4388 domain-containing protein [Pyrinomonadaceae bacterium]|nr:DUF4388 domain-containing protein [Pyrinomonadaceae bacterium]
MALTGHLSDLSLSELIEFFCNQRKTGQLKVLYPDGYGYFYLQAGSVIDARIGVLRGIDAVYYALTLPNAKFEFGPATEGLERTINQPWTQVVLEGLRRLDEGVIPTPAFPPDYKEGESQPKDDSASDSSDLEELRVPSFLSFISKESVSRRKYIAVAVAVVVVMAVAAIGVPAGWYGSRVNPVVSQPNTTEAPVAPAPVQETSTVAEVTQPTTEDSDASDATKRQRERDRIKAREEREQKAALNTSPAAPNPAGSSVSMVESPKGGPKRVTVTVTYDESGRVTQASGGDATAVRIARQKRFPAGKAGSTTVTIPIN